MTSLYDVARYRFEGDVLSGVLEAWRVDGHFLDPLQKRKNGVVEVGVGSFGKDAAQDDEDGNKKKLQDAVSTHKRSNPFGPRWVFSPFRCSPILLYKNADKRQAAS